MKKNEEYEQARKLRQAGLAIPEIAKIINVSKGSVSLWVRDLPQPEKFTKKYKAFKKTERKESLLKLREERNKEKFPSDEKIEEHTNSIGLGGAPLILRRLLSGDGRWMIPAPTYYQGKKYIGERYIYEHRFIMENYLGRLLRINEVVHHKNENKLDNKLENLELKSMANHSSLHAKDPVIVNLICDYCGVNFKREKRKTYKYEHSFCCLSHSVSFQQIERWKK